MWSAMAASLFLPLPLRLAKGWRPGVVAVPVSGFGRVGGQWPAALVEVLEDVPPSGGMAGPT